MRGDPSQQTNEEWLAEYNGKSVSRAHPIEKPSIRRAETLFRYIDHRTTTRGSVVLEFESLDNRIHAVKFFNVNLSSGGKPYPAGHRGQFNPSKRGTFRKFWMQAVGKPPLRWSTVHKCMKSCLGSLIFTGTLIDAYDHKNNRYIKFTEIEAKTGYETGTG